MPYLVHSPEERAEMLGAIGVDSMEGLLVDIPRSLRIPKLELPDGLSEFETMALVASLAERNKVYPDRPREHLNAPSAVPIDVRANRNDFVRRTGLGQHHFD